ncbi:MAG: chromosome segregation protein SMC [Chloroflexi bacterium]|nr:MAG: chromosome segregation protein SMC [Chloroflexota bacterium]
MRLKSLEIQGYKSFANKVKFEFDAGITAVVGPNGSGKSNVADAIRWVLGEQSYRNLRGKKTEDMIFSGSDGRARLGMATATIVLDNSDKWLPLDFSEVTISRRAYRSGENEYYLNGSRVRLKDVAELLAKSGLSRQTYTVIGQGTIDQVLSLHADERRTLFEEAAGITFHRKKRAETLNRLDETRANVIRLNDIVKEIEPQLRRLERQAERAAEYIRLKADLEKHLRTWYGYRWRQGQRALHQAVERLRYTETEVNTRRKELAELVQRITALKTEQSGLRSQLAGWYTENNQLYTQAETVRRELAVNEERIRQYLAQREEILAELEPLRAELQAQEQRLAEARQAVETARQELEQVQADLQQVRQDFSAQQARRQEVVNRQIAAERRVRRLEDSLTERQSLLSQLAERRDALQADQAACDTEIERLTAERGQLVDKQTQLAGHIQSIDQQLAALDTSEANLRAELSSLSEQAEQLKGRLVSLEKQENGLRARYDLLNRLRSEMAGYYQGVRAVLKPQSKLSGIVGTVSQVIRAPSELDVAIEAALGGRLQDVVTRTFADAEAAIQYLKETRQGRATFLPLDTIRPGPRIDVPNTPGVVGLAADLVEADPALHPVVEMTLNRTLIVKDLPAARQAFKAMRGGFQIVTLDGELMRSGGSVTGGRSQGKQAQEGTLLAREREWRELPGQLEALRRQHQEVSAQLADLHERAASVRQKLEHLAESRRQTQEKRQEAQSVADKLSRALEQVDQNLRWQANLKERAQADLARLAQREADTRQAMEQLQQEIEQARQSAEALAAEAASMSTESLQAALSQAQAAASAAESRYQSQQAILTNLTRACEQTATQIRAKETRAAELLAQKEVLEQKQAELSARRASFSEDLDRFAGQIAGAEQRLAGLEAELKQLETQEANLRQRLQRQETDYNRASLDAARRQDELDNLQRQIQEDLGLVNLEMSEEQVGQPVLPIEPLVSELPAVDELPPGLEEEVKRLKVQLKRLGNINPEAPREYAALKERHTFLTSQIADLEEAAADLREVIRRLDESMEEAFASTFKKVAVEFQRYFKALFGGGEAHLQLTDPDNLIETGVEIVARPPGKRLQSMALLSGGERSLTAQALIFALLKISPTPFVIFDEVDAMLDEANVGRFRDALVALARDIQFIVITHNRRTIEAANTIYGISMGEDSVSQAYALKLEDWLEQGGKMAG